MFKLLSTDLPFRYAVGLPLFVFLGPAILSLLIADKDLVAVWIESERGLVENLTMLLALAGAIIAVKGARRAAKLSSRLLTAWLCLFAFGFLYIATEEASWGQHWIAWPTPDWLMEINRYGEANLHNTYRFIDRVPKTIVGITVALAGVGWPLYRRWKQLDLGDKMNWRRWLLPTDATLLIGSFFVFAWIVDRVLIWNDLGRQLGDGFSHSEHRELMMITFLFLYVLCIEHRLRPLWAAHGDRQSEPLTESEQRTD